MHRPLGSGPAPADVQERLPLEAVLAALAANGRSTFYIDVGAGARLDVSPIPRLYRQGWNGLDIEPNRAACTRLMEDRPHGTVLFARMASYTGLSLNWFSLGDDDPLLTSTHGSGAEVGTERVPLTLSLLDAVDSYARAGGIDLLRVGGTAHRDSVIGVFEIEACRPRAILVQPSRHDESESAWEAALARRGYVRIDAAGDERLYVSVTEVDLLAELDAAAAGVAGGSASLVAGATGKSLSDLAVRHELRALREEVRRLTAGLDGLISPTVAAARFGLPDPLALPKERFRGLKGKFRARLGVLRHHDARSWEPPPAQAATVATADLPTISVVTPVYNHVRYIERTIRSVLGQRYPRLEYIVQDGGSSDGTVDVLHRYDRFLSSWTSAPDSGHAQAINQGLGRTSGEIMAWLNSDDMLLPGTLNYVAEVFHRHPAVDVIYGHRVIVDERDREVGRWVLPPHDPEVLKWADFIPQETVFWRRRVWERLGPIDESLHFAVDWDYWLRAQAAGFRFRRVPRFLACFRVHPTQKTAAARMVGDREATLLRARALGRTVRSSEIGRALRRYLAVHVLLHRAYKLKLVRY